MEWTAQESGGITVPEGAHETTGRGTWCYGLVDKVVIGQRLDLVILEIFSNLNDSVKNRFLPTPKSLRTPKAPRMFRKMF